MSRLIRVELKNIFSKFDIKSTLLIFTIFGNNRRRPHCICGPFNLDSVDDIWMLGPCYKVFRRETIEKHLFVERLAPCRENPISVVVDNSLGVGVPTFKERITACNRLVATAFCCASAGNKHQQQQWKI